jgi:nucleoside-diphosphate-sugar epimerase
MHYNEFAAESETSSMRYLITGGSGCIGAWIVRQLLDRGDEFYVLDVRADLCRLRLLLTDNEIKSIRFIVGDVTDLDVVRQVIADQSITNVIHLAGLQVPTCRADPILGARVNVLGTLAVFEAVRLAQPQVQRLVYASSAAVMGPMEHYPADAPVPNDGPLAPSTHYGVFKHCNEENARIYFQDFGLSSVGLRPWAVYGVGRDFGMTSEPTKAIKAVALNRQYAISFGGRLDLQLAEDVARAFLIAAEKPFVGARSFNLRGAVVSIKEFHRLVCEIEPQAREVITFGTQQLGIAPSLDDSEFQRRLGPYEPTPLAEGISRTLEHFRWLHAHGLLDDADLQPHPALNSPPAAEP